MSNSNEWAEPETDNLPAVRDQAPPPVLARAMTDVDSWVEVVRPLINLAEHVADTSFVPKGLRGNSPATAAAMLYGREVGMGPMMALQNVQVIEGSPSLKAEHLRAMVLAAGHELSYPVFTPGRVVARGRRRGQSAYTDVEWNLDMAKAAGLGGKDNWRKYPRAMLAARATGELCRLMFPDVTHGLYAVEELQDDPSLGADHADDVTSSETPPQSSGAGTSRTTVQRRGASKRRGTEGAGGASGPAVAAAEGPVTAPPAPDLPDPAPGPEPALVAPPLLAEDVQAPDLVVIEGGEGSAGGASEGPGSGRVEPAEAPPDGENPPIDSEQVEPEDRERMATREQVTAVNACLTSLGVAERSVKLAILTRYLGREINTSKELTLREASQFLDGVKFAGVTDLVQLRAFLAEVERARGGDGP